MSIFSVISTRYHKCGRSLGVGCGCCVLLVCTRVVRTHYREVLWRRKSFFRVNLLQHMNSCCLFIVRNVCHCFAERSMFTTIMIYSCHMCMPKVFIVQTKGLASLANRGCVICCSIAVVPYERRWFRPFNGICFFCF